MILATVSVCGLIVMWLGSGARMAVSCTRSVVDVAVQDAWHTRYFYYVYAHDEVIRVNAHTWVTARTTGDITLSITDCSELRKPSLAWLRARTFMGRDLQRIRAFSVH